jgi:hypothetical protein
MGATAKKAERLARVRVSEIVQYGEGQGSRIDLTIEVSGRRVRLTRLRASDTMSYRKIRQKAIQQRTALPFFRDGDEVWSEAFCAAMKQACFEPLLEGEEISEAIAEEICLLLAGERGRDAADFYAGKVIEHRDDRLRQDFLVVRPHVLVEELRSRLADDRLPRPMVFEAAASRLGMRGARLRLSGKRLRGWAFPLPLAREEGVGNRSADEAAPMKANDEGEGFEAPGPGGPPGPVHGPPEERPISRVDNEMPPGSNGPAKFPTVSATVHGRRAEPPITHRERELHDRSGGPYVLEPTAASDPKRPGEPAKPGKFDSSKILGKTEPRPLTMAAELKE